MIVTYVGNFVMPDLASKYTDDYYIRMASYMVGILLG